MYPSWAGMCCVWSSHFGMSGGSFVFPLARFDFCVIFEKREREREATGLSQFTIDHAGECKLNKIAVKISDEVRRWEWLKCDFEKKKSKKGRDKEKEKKNKKKWFKKRFEIKVNWCRRRFWEPQSRYFSQRRSFMCSKLTFKVLSKLNCECRTWFTWFTSLCRLPSVNFDDSICRPRVNLNHVPHGSVRGDM